MLVATVSDPGLASKLGTLSWRSEEGYGLGACFLGFFFFFATLEGLFGFQT